MFDKTKKLLKNTVILGTGMLAASVLVDRIQQKAEKEKFKPYGFKVETRFGGMNVEVHGNRGPAILLLSGYGTSAPILDYRPLAKELSRFAKVVILEYLGYGCSDNTQRPRTLKNISEEIHEAAERLNLHDYWLMPHSISGIYVLDYIDRYPQEVAGVLGIDCSVPEQMDYSNTNLETKIMPVLKKLGILRVFNTLMPGKLLPDNEAYSSEELETLQAMSLWQDDNPALKDEGNRIEENMLLARRLSFPKDLPVLMFVSSGNIEMTKGWWQDIHERQLELLDNAEMIILEGSHYLHWTNSVKMAEEVKRFILKTLQKRLHEAEMQLNGSDLRQDS